MTQGAQSDRKSHRLVPPNGKVWLGVLFLVLMIGGLAYQRSASLFLSPVPKAEIENTDSRTLPRQASVDREAISRESHGSSVSQTQKEVIEDLFRKIEASPEDKDKNLRELRRVLHTVFKGQEDCWSCEGTLYFDRLDEIAGRGEGRKPMSLIEWISEGDDAYLSRDLERARQSYSEALAIMDERVFQPEDEVDGDAIDRLYSRCKELDCR